MAGLTVERFATIRALLDAGQPRTSVLAEHGLDHAVWREEEERILSLLADAAEQADLEKLGAYQEAYRAAWRTVAGEGAPASPTPNADPAVGETAPLPALVPGVRLPFAPRAAAEEQRAQIPDEKHPNGRHKRTGTKSFQGVPLTAVLPFFHARAGGVEESPRPAPTAALPAVMDVPVLPFRGSGEAPTPSGIGKLTLAQYAAFCAELEAFPDAADLTFARYGVGSAREGVKLASAWQARFREARDDYEEWQRRHREYLEHCRLKGRPEVPA